MIRTGRSSQPDQTLAVFGVSGAPPDSPGDAAGPSQPKDADRRIPQRGHHPGPIAFADLAPVFVERDVSHPVQAVLYDPVASLQR